MIIDINFSSSVHHPAHAAVFSFHNGNYRSDHGATQVQPTYLVIEYIIVTVIFKKYSYLFLRVAVLMYIYRGDLCLCSQLPGSV